MSFSDLTLLAVSRSTRIKPFDCGDEDLNNFLLVDAINYSNNLLATTFTLEDEEKTIAFFSIFNDSIKVEDLDFPSNSSLRKFISRIVPFGKRHLKYFPAIKIGRLAVSTGIQKSGIGSDLIKYIINFAIEHNEQCACKFISVDAYAASLLFYEKMGFIYLSESDLNEETRQMYFDLTPYLNSQSE